MKLGDNSFSFQTGSPSRFPGKRKSPSGYRRDQRRRRPPDKGMPTPGNHGAESVAPGGPTGARNGIFPPASSSLLCSRTVLWKKHLFSHTNIPQLDGAGSFIAENGLYIHVRTPHVYNFATLVHWERNQSTPLAPIDYTAAAPHPTPGCSTTCQLFLIFP